jgi:WD40 repeat protein
MRYLGLFLAIVALLFLFWQLPNLDNAATMQQPQQELEVLSAENAYRIQRLDPVGRGNIRQMLFSADGHWFAVRTSASVFVFDTQNWHSEPQILRVLDEAQAVAFSPDSQKIAVTGCREQGGDAYNYWQPCLETETHEWWLDNLDIAPRIYIHGQIGVKSLFYILFETDDDPALLLITEGKAMLFQNARQQILDMSFGDIIQSPDLRTLLSVSERSVYTLKFISWPQPYIEWYQGISASIPQDNRINNAHFSADSQYVLIQDSDSNFIWYLAENRLEEIEGMRGELISPDTRYAVRIVDYRYHLRHDPAGFLNPSADQRDIITFEERTSTIGFSPNSRYLLFQTSKMVENPELVSRELPNLGIRDNEQGNQIELSQIYRADLHRFSPDMRLLVYIDAHHDIRVYDLEQQKDIAVLSGYGEETQGIIFNNSGELIYTSCAAWMPVDGHSSSCFTVTLHIGSQNFPIPDLETVRSVAMSPDNRYLVFSGHPDLLWDMVEHRTMAEIDAESQWVDGIFSPDGQLMATTGRLAQVFSVHEDGSATLLYDLTQADESRIDDVAFSLDGKLIATAQLDGTTRLWDSETGQELAVMRSNQEQNEQSSYIRVDGLAFSPDGQWLASGVCLWVDPTASPPCLEAEVQIWNIEQALEAGELLATENARILPGATDYTTSLVFSPNGELLVATGNWYSDGQEIHVWNVVAHELVSVLPSNATTKVAFNPEGTVLLGNGMDGVVYRWGVPSTEE